MEFIFVRHGQSAANKEETIADPSTPLTEQGEGQARDAGKELIDSHISKILVSPYTRAMQTADLIRNELGLGYSSIAVVESLSERHLGTLENKKRQHESLWYFTVEDKSKGIESRTDLLQRMKVAMSEIIKVAKDEEVLVVGHAISGFYLQQLALGNDSIAKLDDPSQLDNADYKIVSIPESFESE